MKDFHEIAMQSKASQDKWELEQLLIELDNIKPKHFLEIGVHLGGGMRHLREAFDAQTLIGLERDTCYEYPDINVLKGVDSHAESTKQAVIDQIDSLFDVIFIDGDHSYAGVQLDFYMYKDLVREGGAIAFHDARLDDNDTCEVFRFWRDIKNRYKHSELFNPSGEGTGVGVIWL